MAQPGHHVYVPHREISDAYPIEFFGFAITDLPLDRRPSEEAMAFTARLVDRFFEKGDVDFVTGDSTASHSVFEDGQRALKRLSFIVGPSNLNSILDGNNETNNWLTDRGVFPSMLHLTD